MSQSVSDLLPYLREAAFIFGFAVGLVSAALICIFYRMR
jgi:hypothetical protein